ncbi:hypothetical protein D3C72_2001520 [compost metagenome]
MAKQVMMPTTTARAPSMIRTHCQPETPRIPSMVNRAAVMALPSASEMGMPIWNTANALVR